MTVMRRNSNLVIQSMQRRGSQNSKTSSNDQHQQHDSGSHIEGNGAASIDDATTTGNGGDSGGKGGIDPAIVAAIRKARGGLEVESFFDSEKNESLASADNNKAPNKSGGESSVEISKTSNYQLESFTHSKKGDTVAEYKSDN